MMTYIGDGGNVVDRKKVRVLRTEAPPPQPSPQQSGPQCRYPISTGTKYVLAENFLVLLKKTLI